MKGVNRDDSGNDYTSAYKKIEEGLYILGTVSIGGDGVCFGVLCSGEAQTFQEDGGDDYTSAYKKIEEGPEEQHLFYNGSVK